MIIRVICHWGFSLPVSDVVIVIGGVLNGPCPVLVLAEILNTYIVYGVRLLMVCWLVLDMTAILRTWSLVMTLMV